MAKFKYSALTAQGRRVRGKLLIGSSTEAMLAMREKGLIVLKLGEVTERWWARDIPLLSPVGIRPFAAFCRQMATMVEAGVTLVDAIRNLQEQAETKAFRNVLEDVERHLEQGDSFSDAIALHPRVFNRLFVSMIRAGEVSGNLGEILRRLAVVQERLHITRAKVKSALTYPVVVSVMSIAVTIFLLVVIVPTFSSMFASLNAPLPLPTRIIIAVSGSLKNQWYVYVATILLVCVGYLLLLRFDSLKGLRDRLILHIPVVGTLIRKSNMARLSRTLCTLLGSSIPLVQSLQMTAAALTNQVIRQTLLDAVDSVSQGQSLTTVFKQSGVYPAMVIQMIQVGEQTGTLDNLLSRVADFYEAEVEVAVDQLKGLIEPMLVVILSVIVGTIVSSIILPMFTILNYIH